MAPDTIAYHTIAQAGCSTWLTWLQQVAVAGINFAFGFLLVVGSYVMVRVNCMHDVSPFVFLS